MRFAPSGSMTCWNKWGCRLYKPGAVSDAIVDAAESWRADLIVLGWHGRTALRRFLFGSIADAVTHQVHCSVELVRIRSGIESLAMATPA
jgi:Universal stress protein family